MISCIKYSIAICVIALSVVSLVYAAEQDELPEEAPAAAIVNGERVLMSDLNREMQKVMASNPELRSKENIAELRKARREALDYLIDQELIFQEGKQGDLKPLDAVVDTEVANVKQRFPSQDAFEQILKKQGLTTKKLREIISRALTVRKVLEVKIKPIAESVADKNVVDFYEENKEGFVEPEKVSTRHILIKISPDATDQEKADAKSKMQSILKEAKGGADFAELAKKHSQCPSASQGGDLGYFTRGRMVKPFEEAAFALQPGQISGIVETQFGYHIILVDDKKSERPLELEEVKEQIKEVLHEKEMDTALRKWLKPIREKATVNILLKG